jgi:hypothetical protein
LHRESTGFVYFRNTLTTGIADNQFDFGDPGDWFVTGDWGIVDGTDTPGLFRPSNFTLYFRHINNPRSGRQPIRLRDTQLGAGRGELRVVRFRRLPGRGEDALLPPTFRLEVSARP